MGRHRFPYLQRKKKEIKTKKKGETKKREDIHQTTDRTQLYYLHSNDPTKLKTQVHIGSLLIVFQ